MKNIHILPKCNSIYITSDEEIKEGDWCLDITENLIVQCLRTSIDSYWNKNCKKIILTTDQDLIKDGIQAIDDEFLEWFVKNPSCEWVDIETMMECEKCGKEHCDNLQCRGYKDIPYYKIIIPNIINDWLEKNGDPQITKQVEQEARELCEQERMYSEEDMREAYKYGKIWDTTSFEEWFEQFKKK